MDYLDKVARKAAKKALKIIGEVDKNAGLLMIVIGKGNSLYTVTNLPDSVVQGVCAFCIEKTQERMKKAVEQNPSGKVIITENKGGDK